VATLAALLWAAPASADLVYTLTDPGSAFVAGGNFGTVTVHQLTSNEVQLTVDLNPNPYGAATPPAWVAFANTSAGFPLTFNYAGDPNIVIAPVTAGFGVPTQNVGTKQHPIFESSGASGLKWKASPFGDFNYAVSCTTACPTGGGSGNSSGPLVVDVTFSSAVTLADFTTVSSGNPGAYFGVDISIAGKTGVVGGNSTPTVQDAPEPASLLIFAGGVAGVAAFRRRKKKVA
jgi:hypothetical protein